jgi:hypothetical protein
MPGRNKRTKFVALTSKRGCWERQNASSDLEAVMEEQAKGVNPTRRKHRTYASTTAPNCSCSENVGRNANTMPAYHLPQHFVKIQQTQAMAEKMAEIVAARKEKKEAKINSERTAAEMLLKVTTSQAEAAAAEAAARRAGTDVVVEQSKQDKNQRRRKPKPMPSPPSVLTD